MSAGEGELTDPLGEPTAGGSGIEPGIGAEDEELAYRETLSVYDAPGFAEGFFDRWGARPPTDELDAFAALVRKGGTVLDAGCGPGHHAAYLVARGLRTVGVDTSRASLTLGRSHFPETRLLVADMLRVPMRAASVSGIWACASIVHLPERHLDPLLGEFARLMEPGGVAAITYPLDRPARTDRHGRYFAASPTRDGLERRLGAVGCTPVGWSRRRLAEPSAGGRPGTEWGTLTVRLEHRPRR